MDIKCFDTRRSHVLFCSKYIIGRRIKTFGTLDGSNNSLSKVESKTYFTEPFIVSSLLSAMINEPYCVPKYYISHPHTLFVWTQALQPLKRK
jgi:hypothetical protein